MHTLLGFDSPRQKTTPNSPHLQGSLHRLDNPSYKQALLELPFPSGGALTLRLVQTTLSTSPITWHVYSPLVPTYDSLAWRKTARHFQRISTLLYPKLRAFLPNPPPYLSPFDYDHTLLPITLIINAIASANAPQSLNHRLEVITQIIRKATSYPTLYANLIELLCQSWQQKNLHDSFTLPRYFANTDPLIQAQWAAQQCANALLLPNPLQLRPLVDKSPLSLLRSSPRFPTPPALPTRSPPPAPVFNPQDLFLLATIVDPSLYCFAQLRMLTAAP